MPSHPPVPARAIFFLSATAFSAAATTRLGDPLLPQIAADFHVTIGQAASMGTAFALTYGLLQAFFGPAGDRFGKFFVILVAAIASIFATFACAFAGSLSALIFLRLLAGATTAAIIPLAIAFVGDVVPYEKRQAVLARFMTGQISGLVIGQALGGALGQHFGWRVALASLALLFMLSSCGLAYELAANPLTRPAPGRPHGTLLQAWGNMAGLLRGRWIRIILAAVFLEGAAMFGPLAFAGAYIHERHGLSLDRAGLALACFGLGGLAYALSVAPLVRRFGETGLARGGGLVLASAFALLALTPWAAGTALAMSLAGFGFYAMHATLQTNGSQMAPEARGAGMALFATFFFLGQSAGVALGAVLFDRFGATPAFGVAALALPVIGFWFAAQITQHKA